MVVFTVVVERCENWSEVIYEGNVLVAMAVFMRIKVNVLAVIKNVGVGTVVVI